MVEAATMVLEDDPALNAGELSLGCRRFIHTDW